MPLFACPTHAARSRSLTVVQENMLNDLVYPTEIVAKRTRVKTDGSKLLKVLVADCGDASIDAAQAPAGQVQLRQG